jgi:hypothetical protein
MSPERNAETGRLGPQPMPPTGCLIGWAAQRSFAGLGELWDCGTVRLSQLLLRFTPVYSGLLRFGLVWSGLVWEMESSPPKCEQGFLYL